MRRTDIRVRLTATALGLAAMLPAPLAAPALAQEDSAPSVVPTDLVDYRCFVVLRDRGDAYRSAGNLSDEQVQIVNNLTIISAFYAGRLTHYPRDEAAEAFVLARRELAAASSADRDELAQACTNFYLSILEALDELERTPQ